MCLRNASLASALGIPSATVIFFCVGTLNTLVLRVLRTGDFHGGTHGLGVEP